MSAKDIRYKTQGLIDQMYEGHSANKIAQKLPAIVQRLDNINVVVTGGISDRFLKKLSLRAYQAIPLESWDNDKEPLEYARHWEMVTRKNRPRSYDGMKIRGNLAGSILDIVLKGPEIHIEPMEKESQTNLF